MAQSPAARTWFVLALATPSAPALAGPVPSPHRPAPAAVPGWLRAGRIARWPGQRAAVGATITIVRPRPPPPGGVAGPVRRSRAAHRTTSAAPVGDPFVARGLLICGGCGQGCARLRRWTAPGRIGAPVAAGFARSTPKWWSGELSTPRYRCSRGRGLGRTRAVVLGCLRAGCVFGAVLVGATADDLTFVTGASQGRAASDVLGLVGRSCDRVAEEMRRAHERSRGVAPASCRTGARDARCVGTGRTVRTTSSGGARPR